MSINFKNNKFHITNDNLSYVIEIGEDKDLLPGRADIKIAPMSIPLPVFVI